MPPRRRAGPALRAIIYLRDLAHYACCKPKCAAAGYRIVGYVLDPTGIRYGEVQDAALAGQAEVIWTHSHHDLPPDRLPRIETDTGSWRVKDIKPPHRRPRPIGP